MCCHVIKILNESYKADENLVSKLTSFSNMLSRDTSQFNKKLRELFKRQEVIQVQKKNSNAFGPHNTKKLTALNSDGVVRQTTHAGVHRNVIAIKQVLLVARTGNRRVEAFTHNVFIHYKAVVSTEKQRTSY